MLHIDRSIDQTQLKNKMNDNPNNYYSPPPPHSDWLPHTHNRFSPSLTPRLISVPPPLPLDDNGRRERDPCPWTSYDQHLHSLTTLRPHNTLSSRLPEQPDLRAPLRMLVLDNPRPRQASFPHLIRQQNTPTPFPSRRQEHEPPESRLREQEQKKAVMNRLRKEIYSPPPKKPPARRLSLYYRDPGQGVYRDKDTDDGQRCAVCLEDFEAGESVMLTPCDHMFHEDCILPWVKSNAQCPVCRFSMAEQERDRTQETTAHGGNGVGWWTVNDVFPAELISIIRAMEDSFISRLLFIT